ncbi:hypothetical protein QBC33DRAFT_587570 [Phialemonium atrogriseum]|uniref:DNA2/NAM7 helicase helicase domain-containing protein n=1 Tax=Phialemonium atrogriseum TaxID=1093897 RepID=A0AAJ0FLB3_9PEZI|nr:uncharacterized protein QBC33DRAFT_587570 [Phialemonium atrogriseum]KAK1767188.1 hypothetical protein QBC33DRAFT_587570 [Phialemonium atrogriseum]
MADSTSKNCENLTQTSAFDAQSVVTNMTMASEKANTPAELNSPTEDNVPPDPGHGNDFADIAAELPPRPRLWLLGIFGVLSRLMRDACLAYFLASDENPSSEDAKYETSKLFAYLMVNAQPFSTPSAEIAAKLAKPIKDSFAFRHYATFYSAMTKVESRHLESPDMVKPYLEQFNSEVADDKLPDSAYIMDLIASKAYLDIDPYLINKVKARDPNLHDKLMTLKQLISQSTREGVVKVSFMFGLSDVLPVQTMENQAKLLAVIQQQDTTPIGRDSVKPLAWAFRASLKVHQLHLGNCPRLDEPGQIPDLQRLPANTRFHDAEEQLAYQVMGAVYDQYMESGNSEALRGCEYEIHAMELSHVMNNRRFVVRVVPSTDDVYLPREGNQCLIQIIGIERKRRNPLTSSAKAVETLISNFISVLRGALNRPDRISVIMESLSMYFAKRLDEETTSRLLQQRSVETIEEWEVRISDYVTSGFNEGIVHATALVQDDFADDGFGADETSNNGKTLWPAERMAHPFNEEQDVHYYMVTVPLEPEDEVPEGQERLPIDVDVPMLKVSDKEDAKLDGLFREWCTKNRPLKARFRTHPSDRTMCAEVSAINDLHIPKGVNPPPSEWSLRLYKWQLDFPEVDASDIYNIFDSYPHMAYILNDRNRVSKYLQEMWDDFDNDKKRLYEQLAACPHRLSMNAGCAGVGKTTLIIFIILMMQFGDKDKEHPCKILHLVNSNNTVNDFATKMAKHHRALGKEDMVVRLHNFESEIDEWMYSRGEMTFGDPFDEEEARNAVVKVTDHFFAHHQLSKLSTDMHKARRSAQVSSSLDDVQRTGQLEPSETAKLQNCVLKVYQDFLAQFNGVVATTPVAANNYKFRTAYGPALDFVSVDEACRMSELSLLIAIARFEPQLLGLFGDPKQLGVHVGHGQAKLIINPYEFQRRQSTLARLVNAGIVAPAFGSTIVQLV